MNIAPILPRFTLALLALALFGCSKPTEEAPAASSQNRLPADRTEERWIVESIVRDLAEMCAYAANRTTAGIPADAVQATPVAGSDGHYQIAINFSGGAAFRQEFVVRAPIWDSGAFTELARSLAKQTGIEPPSEVAIEDAALLKALTAPSYEILQRVNRETGAALASKPLSAEAHEQAALVAASLGFRDNSGDLWDTRTECNRAAAHLAMARALRPKEKERLSDAGQLAELLIALLDDRKRDADGLLADLQTRAESNPVLPAWIRAGKLRNSRDWRIASNVAGLTFLERVEWFRALCESVSTTAALKAIPPETFEPGSDWTRILLRGSFSVDEGQRFATNSVGLTLKDVFQIFPNAARKTGKQLAEALERPISGAVRSGENGGAECDPIDPGMWSRFLQRQLFHCSSNTYYFLKEVWSVSEEASKFRELEKRTFSALTLYPCLAVTHAKGDGQLICQSGHFLALLNTHPECVSDRVWYMGQETFPDTRVSGPAIASWFNPALPRGTAYAYAARRESLGLTRIFQKEDMERLHTIAPTQFEIAQDYLRRAFGSKLTLADFRSVMQPFLGFNIRALSEELELVQNDPAEYVKISRQIAALDPEQNIDLAEYFRDHGQPEAGVECFETAMRQGVDAVRLSNTSRWVVEYYLNHNRKDAAEKLAKFDAEVYSRRGLETMAYYQEQTNDLPGAEKTLKDIVERYNNTSALAGFYSRHPERGKSFLQNLFPGGLKTVALNSFTGPPAHGVLIEQSNALVASAGLAPGDVIVALNGTQVSNFAQYNYVRDLKADPHMAFIVYRNGKYFETSTTLPDHRFNVQFTTWPAN